MKRKEAREKAFQTLFQLDINEDIDDHTEEKNSNDIYLQLVIAGVQDNVDSIDLLISNHLENWALERLPFAERTILRIATFEIEYLDDIPTSVSINEAIDLAHKYGDDKSGQFINGVLSKIIKVEEQ